ncbi:MAG: hypothetical protein Q8L29_01060 [archaeon]|nr:hypothetical protein [archaeon]
MRKLSFSFASLVSFVMLGSFVSALDLRKVSEDAIDFYVQVFEPILRVLLGGQDYTGGLLFEKLLLFLIVLSIIYIALSKVPFFADKKSIKWIIAAAVSLIGIRFMNSEYVFSIILQYELLAIAITAIIPFIVYFFFLSGVFPGDTNNFMRKLGWLLFVMIYGGLWLTAANNIQSSIFFWTMIAGIIFAFFDGYVEKFLHSREFGKAERSRNLEHIIELNRKIRNWQSSDIPERDKIEEIKKLEKQKKYWMKHR